MMRTGGGDFLVGYGSQTGQCEAIASIIEARARQHGLRARVHPLNDIGKKFWIEREPLLIIVCSSTGDGDPPDNAVNFVRFISKRSLPSQYLNSTTYALLGLGDSNYSTFQGNPRLIEKHLIRLGARKLIETGAADDQIGLELTVEPWLTNLFDALQKRFKSNGITMKPSDNDAVDLNLLERLSLEGNENREIRLNEIMRLLKIHSPNWPEDVPCLVRGSPNLHEDSNLRVPVALPPYLKCQIMNDDFFYDTKDLPWQNGCVVTGALNEKYQSHVVRVTELTSPRISKPKKEIVIEFENNSEVLYEPGDAFYFVVPNPRNEVDFILERMGLLEKADLKFFVNVKSGTTKRNALVPPYIPEISTLRYIFTWCLDIRRSPGRPLLRVLAECTDNEAEKRRILELCSAQGVEEFTKFVRQAGLSLVDFLLNFPSCWPPVERLIELLPRLMPRPYSVSCIRELWKKRVRFVFSLMNFSADDGRRYHRHGLCSGWLATLKEGERLLMFRKEPSRFHLPPPTHYSCNVVHVPLIMICTGTGLAPFLSFLQKLEVLEAEKHKVRRELYFGCRSIKEDCIYHEEIQRYASTNVLSYLSICESNSNITGSCKKYVQDALLERGGEIVELFMLKDNTENYHPMVFVCGSATAMLQSVSDMFVHIFEKFLDKSREEAESFLMQLKKNDQYIEDVW